MTKIKPLSKDDIKFLNSLPTKKISEIRKSHEYNTAENRIEHKRLSEELHETVKMLSTLENDPVSASYHMSQLLTKAAKISVIQSALLTQTKQLLLHENLTMELALEKAGTKIDNPTQKLVT